MARIQDMSRVTMGVTLLVANNKYFLDQVTGQPDMAEERLRDLVARSFDRLEIRSTRMIGAIVGVIMAGHEYRWQTVDEVCWELCHPIMYDGCSPERMIAVAVVSALADMVFPYADVTELVERILDNGREWYGADHVVREFIDRRTNGHINYLTGFYKELARKEIDYGAIVDYLLSE